MAETNFPAGHPAAVQSWGKRTMKKSSESHKISKLMKEGKSQKAAVGEALAMKRAGRLGPQGGYRRVGK